MTYRIRSLRTGLYFAGLDSDAHFGGRHITVWSAIDYTPPAKYASVGEAAKVIAVNDLDHVEIVEELS